MPNDPSKTGRWKCPPKVSRYLSADPILARVMRDVPIAFTPPTGRIYEDLLEAIIYQQISIRAAKTVHNRFLTLFDGIVPEPDVLASAPVETLRSAGMSGVKAQYLLNVAEYYVQNNLSDDLLMVMPEEEFIRQLVQIRGVGRWTVEMILIFSLGRPDVFPVSDLGIQQAIESLYSIEELAGKALQGRLTSVAEQWRPYRTYAMLYLWSWKRVQMGYHEG